MFQDARNCLGKEKVSLLERRPYISDVSKQAFFCTETSDKTLGDRDDLSTKDTCFNLFDLRDRDDLSTRDKIIGPMCRLFGGSTVF